ncbi:E3 SUMO-protein ligase ZBED1 [Frankliniella fusca]|uniref:E3 SUMO-protein ligase ZBED1 n=1 Tax=Frankliniella fusca TaxID=407009 RepID=A0AAE1GU09_9NEOP|nr:E3 SUMO-protein ligase ZBED1 [Frankliniella fusca]
MQQKIATFLLPAYRHLQMLDEDEKKEVYDHVRSLLPEKAGAGQDNPDNPTDELPPAKRGRVRSKFSKWKPSPSSKTDEVTAYLANAPSIDLEDLFAYCRAEQPITGRFPVLAKLAHGLMGKPAASAGSERSFSRAGFLIQCRRNRLSPRTIDNILFLDSYLNNKLKK